MDSRPTDHQSQHDVLIVSTTPLIREVFHDIFLATGYPCLLAADGHEALEMYRGWRPSLVVTDFNLPDMCALELLQDLRHEDPDAVVIILCGSVYERGGNVVGFLDLEAVRAAGLKLGAHAFVLKPVDIDELLLTAERALEARQIARRRRQPLEHHWSDVRPMAGVSELLAVFAAVFTISSARRAPHHGDARTEDHGHHHLARS